MSVSTVSFLSGLTVLAMACINVWKNRRSQELEPARSIPLGIGAALGGITGKWLFSSLKTAVGADQTVGAVQSFILFLMVVGTILYVINKDHIRTRDVKGWFLPVLISLLLGIASSFLGIGGGPMNLAVLYYFFSMSTKKAAVNSILIILLSQAASLLMTLAAGTVPAFSWSHLAAMVLAGALGGFLSARLHKKLSAKQTDLLFLLLLIVIAGICMYNTIQMIL